MWMSHRALQHVCMCGSKWWWSLSFSVWRKQISPPCCLLCNLVSLALTVTNTHPFSVADYVLSEGSCMPSVPRYMAMATWVAFSRESLIGLSLCYITHNYLNIEKKTFRTILFNPGMQGGMGKCVGRDWHLYGFLLSLNFEDSLLTSQDSVMHVKTQF